MVRQAELQLQFRDSGSNAEIALAKSWRGVSVQFSRLRLPAEYAFRWDGNSHYLCYHDLVLIDGEMEILGEAPVAGGDLRDKMTYVPAGQTIDGWAKPADRMNAFTVVCFDPNVMEEELQAEFNGPAAEPHIYFNDDELGKTMRKLGRLMADRRRPAARVYAEAVGLTAALEMFRITQTGPANISASGQLTQAQARMARDYIEQYFATDIGLDDLASICGLTRFHFSRAFKATFGEPPHKVLTLRRMEQARHMLATTQLPISDIALACGFNGASQFSRAFREVVGLTPIAFRRQS